MNRGLKIFLSITAILLAAAVYWSITGPAKFNKERDRRYISVIAQLQDVGEIQKEYYNQTKQFLGDMQSVVNFADTADYILRERKDTTYYITNNQGIKIPQNEVIYRELGRVPLKDSIFKGRDVKGLLAKNVGDMKPYHTDLVVDTLISADSANTEVRFLFKTYATKREILEGMEENGIINEISEGKGIRDTVVSVGSLVLRSTEGNWTPEQGNKAMQLKKREEEKIAGGK